MRFREWLEGNNVVLFTFCTERVVVLEQLKSTGVKSGNGDNERRDVTTQRVAYGNIQGYLWLSELTGGEREHLLERSVTVPHRQLDSFQYITVVQFKDEAMIEIRPT